MTPEVWIAVIGLFGLLVRALFDLSIIKAELRKQAITQNSEVERVTDLALRLREIERKLA